MNVKGRDPVGKLGRMTRARAERAIRFPNRVELWGLDHAITIIKDDRGVPIQAERRCKNPLCCEQKPDKIAIHVWDLTSGEYETKYSPAPSRH